MRVLRFYKWFKTGAYYKLSVFLLIGNYRQAHNNNANNGHPRPIHSASNGSNIYTT